MSLTAAADLLTRTAKQPLRAYSTFDFGRQRDESARSVVVPSEVAEQILHEVRTGLPAGMIAFIGTRNWLGDETHSDQVEIVVAPGKDQFDILRVARSNALNYDMETEDLVRKLTSWDEAYGITIDKAETDRIHLHLHKLPEPLTPFCEDLYEFCPDIVDQGCGSVDDLEEIIREYSTVYLWWD
jgi:hypothetical protein